MKQLLFVALVALITACSSPRYAANFHYYKSNPDLARGNGVMKTQESIIAPIEPEKLVASANNKSTGVIEKTPTPIVPMGIGKVVAADHVRKAYFQMNKAERHDLRKALKAVLKNKAVTHPSNAPRSGQSWWQGWDQDLKLAAIFGAIGTTAMIIYVEPFFVIGVVALIVGLVFFIKWFVRQ